MIENADASDLTGLSMANFDFEKIAIPNIA